jgi:Tfp pilus assembly protein PilF
MGEAWLFLGVVRQRLSHQRRAIRALSRAVACMPELGEAHNQLGVLLMQQRRHQEAYQHLERAVDLLPWESGPRVHMAQACCFLGRVDEGREMLEEAQRLGADGKLLEAVRQTFFSE